MMTERLIQEALMNYCMYRLKHTLCVPNSKSIVGWEADLLSMTKTGLFHEYEIKISMSDFLADRNKKRKHQLLKAAHLDGSVAQSSPSYFWYATTFDIQPPDYAGWILVKSKFNIIIKKRAPRLHRLQATENQVKKIARLLTFRLLKVWGGKYKR